jgi:hypothetical protein
LDLLRKRKLDAKDKLANKTKINSSDKNVDSESMEKICDLAEPSKILSDGHGDYILPNSAQVASQDPPQDNSQVTGL